MLRNHTHVKRQPVMVGRVRPRAVDAAFGEDNELSGLHRQLDAILNLLIEVERVSGVVKTFLAAELDRANPVVRAAGKPQTAALRRGIVNGDPNGQLKNLA